MSDVMVETAQVEPLLRPGNTNCAGCGMSVGLQWLGEVLASQRPYMAIPACCGIVSGSARPRGTSSRWRTFPSSRLWGPDTIHAAILWKMAAF